MAPRFYCSTPIVADTAELDGQEHQHLAKVLRLTAGQQVTLFDGSGQEFSAQIESVSRNQTQLQILRSATVDRELPFDLTLAVALPKGDRQQWLVEKATELGVTRLLPLATQRGVSQPRDKALQRLQKWVVAASKQCGRNRLMEILPAQKFSEFVAQSGPENHTVYIAHPYNAATSLPQLTRNDIPNNLVLSVGPEGGFTDEEVEAAVAGGHTTLSLGSRILRIETAAVASVAAIVLACA